MTIKGKGKEVAGKGKAPVGRGDGDGNSGGGRKRKNRGVLQFFEDTADVDDTDESDYSDFGDDFVEEDIEMAQTMNIEPIKGQNLPFFPKEEMIDEEEFDKMMEERYGDGSRFYTYAGDEFDDKTIEPNSVSAALNDPSPTIWKVKCVVGRERLSAFCLMQKFVDLKLLGNKLNIVSAFAVDHMKGLIYIEAEKQCDINEACKGLSSIYVTRVQPVPKNEVSHLFNARSRCNEVSEGTWVRVKSGIYKGDLAQVVAVNNARRRATVKLIPRIDLQAMAAKFGGGYNLQKGAVPAPRLISSSELEEFRPLMQIRRDRDTGKVFEVLDGLMLKDGFLYKKVAVDSLNLWGVEPTEEELLKFRLSEGNEENDLEWLSQIYGEPKKRRILGDDKVGGKGESSSGAGTGYSFELYDLVCFKRKEFGIIIGMEKDDSYKILKESAEGPVVVTVERRNVKSGSFDIKLSAQDQHKKTILVNDTVRVLEGPSKDRQGIVKHIYRGVVFLYDENEEENGGYFTSKSHMCEKVKLSVGDYSGKGSEPGTSVFEDLPSSPKSPLSPKRPWQARENREFNRGDNDAPFTIGQTLRIRVGPLKGYICRVIAIRRTDVTVKLDSQQKVFTVKCENLSEVQGKRTAMPTSGDPDSSSFKPFDLLGTGGSSGGWMDGVGTSAGNDGWNTGGVSAERSAWSSQSNFLQTESTANPINAEGNNSGQGAEDTAWEVKSTSNQNSSWGAKCRTDADPDQSGGWAKGGGSWGQTKPTTGSTADENQNSGWNNKPNDADGNQPSGWESKSNWNTPKMLQPGESSATEWGKGNSKSGSDDGGNMKSTWGSGKEVNGTDGNQPSGWESKGNWNTTKTLQPGGSSATEWAQGNSSKSGPDNGGNLNSKWGSWKSGKSEMDTEKPGGTSNESKDGNQPCSWENKSNWNNPISSSQEKKMGWNQKSAVDDKDGKGIDQDGWNSGKTSGQASGWEKGSSGGEKSACTWVSGSSGAEDGSKWGTFKSSSSGVEENQNSGWGKVNNRDDKGNQDSSWGIKNHGSSIRGDNGDGQGNSWGQKSNWKSGSSYTEQSEHKDVDGSNNYKSDIDASSGWGASGANKNTNWGKNSNKDSGNTSWKSGSGSGNENQNSNWSTERADAEIQDSNWGKKSNWNGGNQNSGNSSGKSGSGSGNEIQNSNWSTERAHAETQDSNWGKKGNGNGGNQDSGNSSWKSGSGGGNENQNSNWSNWGKKTNWNSGNGGNQDSGWNKSNNGGSGSGNTSQNSWGRNNNWQQGNASNIEQLFRQNEDPNETSGDGGSSGNWRGGYGGRNGSDRGGFRGRGGYRGRGERGGYGGGRGDLGGYGGRGDRGGSGRGFGGRGRGRRDQAGGWNNRRDSGENGSSDWNKGADNDVEGWKNNSGSGSWSQGSGEKKDWQSWNGGNDKEPSSWNKGGGSNW